MALARLDAETSELLVAARVLPSTPIIISELVRNAIEAGATRISLTIRGLDLTVSDNGCGFAPDANRRSLSESLADGDRPTTLVCLATLSTLRVCSEPTGSTALPRTSVSVKDLFSRLPVRRRHAEASWQSRSLWDALNSVLLLQPRVGLRLWVQQSKLSAERKTDVAPAVSVRERFAEIHGADIANALVKIRPMHGDVPIIGLVGPPTARLASTSRHQYLFVGGRGIEHAGLSSAIERVYTVCRNVLEPKQQPSVRVRSDKSAGMARTHAWGAPVYAIRVALRVGEFKLTSPHSIEFRDEAHTTAAVVRAVWRTFAVLHPELALFTSRVVPVLKWRPRPIKPMVVCRRGGKRSQHPSPVAKSSPPYFPASVASGAETQSSTAKVQSFNFAISDDQLAVVAEALPTVTPPTTRSMLRARERGRFDVAEGTRPPRPRPLRAIINEWLKAEEIKAQEADVRSIGDSVVRLAGSTKTRRSLAVTRTALRRAQLVGQVDKKFLIAFSAADGLMIVVDQHAAHERVRLEALASRIEAKVRSDPVDPPKRLCLSPREVHAIVDHRTHIERWGFHFQGPDHLNAIVLTAVPRVLSAALGIEDFIDFVAQLVDVGAAAHNPPPPPAVRRILNSRACRGAVMFGTRLSSIQARALLRDLAKCQTPFLCAHGRPTVAPLLTWI